MSLLNNISSKLSEMPTTQKMLAVAIVTALSIGAGAAAYISNSDANNGYVSLISSKNSADIPNAITQLDTKEIKYQITPNGDLLVNEKDIIAARNVLAKNGDLFSSKTGYDLLNKEQSIFINSTQQQLLKTQVIEENLQQTLEQIKGVEAAKVHLSLSETSEFMRDTNKSTASIMLELAPGDQLSEEQVRSIANLVSSSVPFLSPDDVVITDQYAQQLSGNTVDNYGMSVGQLRYKAKVEGKLHASIMQVIAPLIGLQNMRVSVNADINYDKIHNTKEEYLKNPRPIQSEQLEYDYDGSRGNVGKGRLEGSLKAAGTLSNPTLAGTLYARDVKAKLPFSFLTVGEGKIVFRPQNGLIPTLQINGKSQIGSHNVNLNVYGSADSPKTAFSSYPPLPEHEIMTLLATGTTNAGLENRDVATFKALQILLLELKDKSDQPGGNKLFSALLSGMEDLDLRVGEVDDLTGEKYASATVKLHERWYLTTQFDSSGQTRGLVVFALRFN